MRKLKKIPTTLEYEELSRYSISPLLNRFKTWGRVPGVFLQKATECGWANEWADVMEIIATHEHEKGEPGKMCATMAARPEPRIFMDRPFYGPPLNREPLAHGPTNEAGVLFLFAAKAKELGFVVQRIQAGYPDCEAMREVGPDRWQRVNAELEHQSRNFLKRGHDISKCDLIRCWEHNWPECPLEVLELKSVIEKLAAQLEHCQKCQNCQKSPKLEGQNLTTTDQRDDTDRAIPEIAKPESHD